MITAATVGVISSYVIIPLWAKPYRGTVNGKICANNLRQIGIALSLYCEDNDGRYPYAMASCCLPICRVPAMME